MDLSALLLLLSHKLAGELYSAPLKSQGKIKKRKTGMVKIVCKACSCPVNSVVFTKHLERCSAQSKN